MRKVKCILVIFRLRLIRPSSCHKTLQLAFCQCYHRQINCIDSFFNRGEAAVMDVCVWLSHRGNTDLPLLNRSHEIHLVFFFSEHHLPYVLTLRCPFNDPVNLLFKSVVLTQLCPELCVPVCLSVYSVYSAVAWQWSSTAQRSIGAASCVLSCQHYCSQCRTLYMLPGDTVSLSLCLSVCHITSHFLSLFTDLTFSVICKLGPNFIIHDFFFLLFQHPQFVIQSVNGEKTVPSF